MPPELPAAAACSTPTPSSYSDTSGCTSISAALIGDEWSGVARNVVASPRPKQPSSWYHAAAATSRRRGSGSTSTSRSRKTTTRDDVSRIISHLSSVCDSRPAQAGNRRSWATACASRSSGRVWTCTRCAPAAPKAEPNDGSRHCVKRWTLTCCCDATAEIPTASASAWCVQLYSVPKLSSQPRWERGRVTLAAPCTKWVVVKAAKSVVGGKTSATM